MKTIKRMVYIFLLIAIATVLQPASAQVVEADQTTAVPIAVDYGPASSLAGVRLSVLRGWTATSVFAVYVTVAAQQTTLGSCQLLLSDTDVFGYDKSQAVLFVDFQNPTICPGNSTDAIPNSVLVCATVQQLRDGVFTDFSSTVCNDLTPQDP